MQDTYSLRIVRVLDRYIVDTSCDKIDSIDTSYISINVDSFCQIYNNLCSNAVCDTSDGQAATRRDAAI